MISKSFQNILYKFEQVNKFKVVPRVVYNVIYNVIYIVSLYMYVLVGSLWREGGNMENWAFFLGTHGHIRGNTARAVPRESSGEIKHAELPNIWSVIYK